MSYRRLGRLLMVPAAVSVLLMAGCAGASAGGAPAPLVTTGVVGSLERDGTVIIVTPERKGVVVRVVPKTALSRNGFPAELTQVKVGDKVEAVHFPGGVAKELTATGK